MLHNFVEIIEFVFMQWRENNYLHSLFSRISFGASVYVCYKKTLRCLRIITIITLNVLPHKFIETTYFLLCNEKWSNSEKWDTKIMNSSCASKLNVLLLLIFSLCRNAEKTILYIEWEVSIKLKMYYLIFRWISRPRV